MSRKHRRAIFWMLVAALTFSPSMAACQSAADSGQAPPAATATTATTTTATTATTTAASDAKWDADLGYVTPETVAAVIAYPRRVLTAPEMELMPTEVITAAGIKELGIDPLQVEKILVLVEPPLSGPPGWVVVMKMANPLPKEKSPTKCGRRRK